MDVKLLQYNVGSHSRKGEVVKQQLVQTALQQGLCDLALLQGCSGIHEPVRAGSGAVYQPAFVRSAAVQPAHEAGTLFCYTADRFKVRQLSTILEDLPGCQHSMLLLEDIITGTTFIAVVLSVAASSQAQQQHPLLAKLWHLMRELSSQCPVLAAGEFTTSSEAEHLCSDPVIQLHLCQPVQGTNSISQSFFAAACSPPYSLQISDVKSLLARPAAAAVQYSQNAHTALCLITCSTATAAGKSALSVGTQSGFAKDDGEGAKRSSQLPCGHNAATEQLQALVDAASMRATAPSTVDAHDSCSDTGGLSDQQAASRAHESQQAAGPSASSGYQPVQIALGQMRGGTWQTPASLNISHHPLAQVGDSEIEPKPPTPAARPRGGHQLSQTSSGNLCFVGPPSPGSAEHQLAAVPNGLLPQTPVTFQLQPRPTGQQHIDIHTLRIMQLRRTISELSAGTGAQDCAVSGGAAALTSELHARLSQQRQMQQLSQLSSDESTGGVRQGPLSSGGSEGRAEADREDEALQSGSGTDAEDDTGLYAAAKQVPGELKAAWNKLVQQPAERKGIMRRQGRNSEEKMASPGRLLGCLQSKTDSDVEAQMEAVRFKH
ncbi:hypothetical protein WJX77_000351 [Trebouxia sp. C0004]